jgi:hypothetical protein
MCSILLVSLLRNLTRQAEWDLKTHYTRFVGLLIRGQPPTFTTVLKKSYIINTL